MGKRIPSSFTVGKTPWAKRVMSLQFYSNLEDLEEERSNLMRLHLPKGRLWTDRPVSPPEIGFSYLLGVEITLSHPTGKIISFLEIEGTEVQRILREQREKKPYLDRSVGISQLREMEMNVRKFAIVPLAGQRIIESPPRKEDREGCL